MSKRNAEKRPEKRTPKFRHHKASGQGFVELNGRRIYLGRYDAPETLGEYHRAVAEWLAAGRQLPTSPDEITVVELIARYLAHAREYYVNARSGSPSNEYVRICLAIKPVRKLYSHTLAKDFGPLALRTIQQEMVGFDWCRTNINAMIGRVRRMFRWGVGEELIPPSVFHGLQAVEGLRAGRCAARETEPVRPAPQEHIDAVEQYVSRQVWAMIQLQLLTAARAGEIVIMRPKDIEQDGKVWLYRPTTHKTAHRGHERVIYIGPRGQEALKPFMLRPADSFCFSPVEADAERRRSAHAARKTPLSCGNKPGSNKKRNPRTRPGDCYSTASYARAIKRAIKLAFRPEGMSGKEFKAWKAPQHWRPHQLRHNAATYLRKEFDIEAAQIILGHRSPTMTALYAELDATKAIDAMLKVG